MDAGMPLLGVPESRSDESVEFVTPAEGASAEVLPVRPSAAGSALGAGLPPYYSGVSRGGLRFDAHSVLNAVQHFQTEDFIQTASGNRVAVHCVLCGSNRVHMSGRSIIHPGAVLRADLAALRIGKFVEIGSGTALQPSTKNVALPAAAAAKAAAALPGTRAAGGASPPLFGVVSIPMSIGDFVQIGANCVINAVNIGTGVVIGDECVIGKRCVLKDWSCILSGTVLPDDRVVPSFAVFGGNPARYLGDLHESTTFTQKRQAVEAYRCFAPALPSKKAASMSDVTSSEPEKGKSEKRFGKLESEAGTKRDTESERPVVSTGGHGEDNAVAPQKAADRRKPGMAEDGRGAHPVGVESVKKIDVNIQSTQKQTDLSAMESPAAPQTP